MTVVHIVPGVPFGGMQRLVLDLATEQIRQGLTVKVIVLCDCGPLAARLQDNQVPTYVTPGSRPSLSAIRRLAALLRDCAPDLVHLHEGVFWSNLTGLAEKRCPWLYHAHNYPWRASGLRPFLVNSTNHWLSDAIVGVSRSVSQAYMSSPRRGRKPVFTVYNGIRINAEPLRPRTAPRDRGPVFGMATRFTRDKGVFEFIEVAARISQHLKEARFALAGDGPLLSEARARVLSVGLKDRFSFLGFVTDTDQFWRGLDVAVFTSPSEPFGLRLIEPMMLGTPVVAYLTGAGSDELLEEGENALIAKWGDPESLAVKAIGLCDDSAYATNLCRRAREIVEQRFSIETMAKNLAERYDEISSQ